MPDFDPKRHSLSYARHFTKLSLWYARKRILSGESDFEDAINVRVNILRNTSLFDGKAHPANGDELPEWSALVERVREIFDTRIQEDDTNALEEEGLAVFWPVLEARASRANGGPPNYARRPYESWSCDYRRGDRLSIHIGNVYKPHSPLSEKRDHFAAALLRLLEDSQVRRPDIETVGCGSWLNGIPSFLDLFPPVWQVDTSTSTSHNYTLGHWGQFTDRRGDFHERNGMLMRESGAFPYPCTTCTAPIDETLDHLRSNFPAALSRNKELGHAPGQEVVWW